MKSKYPNYYNFQQNPFGNMRVNPARRPAPVHQRNVEYTPYRAMSDMTGMVVMGGVTLATVGTIGSLAPLFAPK